jgi:hypothetical protein
MALHLDPVFPVFVIAFTVVFFAIRSCESKPSFYATLLLCGIAAAVFCLVFQAIARMTA